MSQALWHIVIVPFSLFSRQRQLTRERVRYLVVLNCEFSPVERRLALKEAAQKDLSSLAFDSAQSPEAAKPAVPSASSDTNTSPTRTAHRTLQWADILIGPPPQFSRSEAPPPTPEGSLWNESYCMSVACQRALLRQLNSSTPRVLLFSSRNGPDVSVVLE